MWHQDKVQGIEDLVDQVLDGTDLTEKEAYQVMDGIGRQLVSPELIDIFLHSLNSKGETIDEITGFAKALRKRILIVCPKTRDLVDVCGTGGGETSTFNISTASAFIAAGAGVKIAKHGNRSFTSRCGSADVLQALGVNINLTPIQVEKCIDQIGIGFIYAPNFHPAMPYVSPVRQKIGGHTIFNLLGPLTNPARVSKQVIGVSDGKWVFPIAQVLRKLGAKRALVVHGEGGLDEISSFGLTEVADLNFGTIGHYSISPDRFGIKIARAEDLRGGSPEENAFIVKTCLDTRMNNARQDIALINAAAVIVVSGLAPNLELGMEMAKMSIILGKARQKLDDLINFGKE